MTHILRKKKKITIKTKQNHMTKSYTHTEIRQRMVQIPTMCHHETEKVDNKEAIHIHWTLHSRLLSTFSCVNPKENNHTTNVDHFKRCFLLFLFLFLHNMHANPLYTLPLSHFFTLYKNTIFLLLIPHVFFRFCLVCFYFALSYVKT